MKIVMIILNTNVEYVPVGRPDIEIHRKGGSL